MLFNTVTASRRFTATPAAVRLQQQLIPRSTAPSTAALSLAWRHAVLSWGDSGQATSMSASASTFAYSAVPCHPRDGSIEGRTFTSLAHALYAWTTYIYIYMSVVANISVFSNACKNVWASIQWWLRQYLTDGSVMWHMWCVVVQKRTTHIRVLKSAPDCEPAAN